MNRRQRRHEKWDQEIIDVAEYGNKVMRDVMPEEYFRRKVAALNNLQRNGITAEDLKANYDKGWSDGFTKAAEPVIQAAYAAVCLALNELYKFGSKRCADVLNCMDGHMLYSLTSEEAIDEVYKRMKLRINFKEAFDRVQEVDE